MKTTLLVLLIVTSVFAGRGRSGGMGNGGHPYEIQFHKDAKEILQLLKREDIEIPKELKAINLYHLEMDIETVDLEVKRKKLRDKFGKVKCALNFPGEKLIQFNKKCWEKIRDNKAVRLAFVLHEYLGISGQEVDSYNTSYYIIDALRTRDEVNAAKLEAERQKKLDEQQAELDAEEAFLASAKKNTITLSNEIKSEYPGIEQAVEISVEEIAYLFKLDLAYRVAWIEKLASQTICINLGYRFSLGVVLDSENVIEPGHRYSYINSFTSYAGKISGLDKLSNQIRKNTGNSYHGSNTYKSITKIKCGR